MEAKISNNTFPSGAGTANSEQHDAVDGSTAVRVRISTPTNAPPPHGSREADIAEVERLARRYGREAQLALEGLLYWGLRWPFEVMATLVASGRKWEEDYYRPGP